MTIRESDSPRRARPVRAFYAPEEPLFEVWPFASPRRPLLPPGPPGLVIDRVLAVTARSWGLPPDALP
ncbi:MAG: hypothetical protein N2544_01715 [Burkholderiales bacterium]|nr:hypothetical protein [Burkholderiales bacterium]